MTQDYSEGCNCTCHDKKNIMCSQCKGQHNELREKLDKRYAPIETDIVKRKRIL